MQEKIFHEKFTFYSLPLGPGNYFMRGTYYVFGKNAFSHFAIVGKSGSQALWLPSTKYLGLKIFHPKGLSGTLQKAWTHFKVQKMLWHMGLAPQPRSFLKVNVELVKCGEVGSPWSCYGIVMERELRGTKKQILKNLSRFGVPINKNVDDTVMKYLLNHNQDALTLLEYKRLCVYFCVDEEPFIQKLIVELKEKIPSNINVGDDLLSISNIVLDENGKIKVIDCDLASIRV